MTDRVYFVTGTSSGIGSAIAKRLSADGATVVGTHNSNTEAAQLALQEGWVTNSLRVDLADRKARLALIEKVKSEYGKLSGIVNNAAEIDFALWDDFSMNAWYRVFEANVHAPMHLAHALKDRLVPGGGIVNIASTDGMTGTFASPAYSASKAALMNATKSLGNVFGPLGIRVNAIAPGWVDTGMSTEASYSAGGQTPLGRNGRPTEIADAVLFLLGPESTFVNGATLIVDGGYTNVDTIMLQELQDLNAEDTAANDGD